MGDSTSVADVKLFVFARDHFANTVHFDKNLPHVIDRSDNNLPHVINLRAACEADVVT